MTTLRLQKKDKGSNRAAVFTVGLCWTFPKDNNQDADGTMFPEEWKVTEALHMYK